MKYTPTSEADMGKCCDICGDVGVIEAIVTCNWCKSSCEHLYCMRPYREVRPESWFCEECKDLTTASSLNGKLQCDSAHLNELPNDRRWNSIVHGKKIQTSKVKPLSAQDVIMLTSGAKISGSLVKVSSCPSTIPRKRRSVLERTPIKPGGILPKSNSKLVRGDPSSEHLKQMRPPVAWQTVAQSFGGIGEKDATQSPRQKQTQKGQLVNIIKDNADIRRAQIIVGEPAKQSTTASPLTTVDQPIFISDKGATQAPLEKHTLSRKECVQTGQPMNDIINNADIERAPITVGNVTRASMTTSPPRVDQPVGNSRVAVSSDMKIQMADPRNASPLSAPTKVGMYSYIPASDASWKGSFNVVLDDPKKWEISVGIQAHPPSRVRRKVYESSKLMPKELQFELVPRGSLWMSLFENYSLDRRDIGLYLFPSTPERCKNYTSLLEHIGEHDLVLRKYMDGLELLIFTSKILNIDCQRWKGMYFLWGVFHHIKLATSIIKVEENQCHDEGNNNEAVEMEIDMIGVQNVGGLDSVVPRIPLQLPPPNIAKETFFDSPPGFEKIGRPKVETSYASATKSKLGPCVKVERADEKNQICPGTSMREDDSIQTSSAPVVLPRLNFQHPLKNVKSEGQ